MAITYDMISRAQARSLEEFSDAFRSAYALGDIEPWAQALGLAHTSNAIKTTFPIPVSAAGYQEFKGDMKYRSLFARTLSMVPRLWQDGISELAQIVEASDFLGWSSEPAAMAQEAQRLPNTLVAEALEANANAELYRDDESNTASSTAFFSGSHPYNVFDSSIGTFDNDHSGAGAINKAMFTTAKENFRSMKAPNGKPLGLRMTHFLVPAALEEEAKEFLEQDMLIEAVTNVAGTENVAAVAQNNRHKGTVSLVVCDELTAATTVYALALNKPGLYPWIVQTTGTPEEILMDKSSYLYQTQLKVGLSYTLSAAAKLAMPHCIQRFVL